MQYPAVTPSVRMDDFEHSAVMFFVTLANFGNEALGIKEMIGVNLQKNVLEINSKYNLDLFTDELIDFMMRLRNDYDWQIEKLGASDLAFSKFKPNYRYCAISTKTDPADFIKSLEDLHGKLHRLQRRITTRLGDLRFAVLELAIMTKEVMNNPKDESIRYLMKV